MNGWYVSEKDDVTIGLAGSSLGYLGSAKCGLSRLDIKALFPSSIEHSGGWECVIDLPRLPEGEEIVASMFINGRRLIRRQVIDIA